MNYTIKPTRLRQNCVLNSVDKKPHFVISRPRDDQVCTKYYISKQNCKSDELNEHSHSRIKF